MAVDGRPDRPPLLEEPMPRRLLAGGCLALVLVVLLPPASAQTGKKARPKAPSFLVGTYAAKVLDVDDGAKTMKIHVTGLKIDLEVSIDEKAKVRVPPKEEFDEKGNPKRF